MLNEFKCLQSLKHSHEHVVLHRIVLEHVLTNGTIDTSRTRRFGLCTQQIPYEAVESMKEFRSTSRAALANSAACFLL
jgi:hypothetical protein